MFDQAYHAYHLLWEVHVSANATFTLLGWEVVSVGPSAWWLGGVDTSVVSRPASKADGPSICIRLIHTARHSVSDDHTEALQETMMRLGTLKPDPLPLVVQ